MTPEMKQKFRELVDIQCQSGNWDYDPYMHGMANGMLLALSMIEDTEYHPLDAPTQWLRDHPRDLVSTKSN